MRPRVQLAAVVCVAMALVTACAGRSQDSSRLNPAGPAVRTLAPGAVVPWADIPAPLESAAQPPIPALQPSLTVPSVARAGAELRYELTLRNTGAAVYRWSSNCPVFLAILQTPPPEPRNVAGNHQQLNCAPAADLPPGGEARFEMRLFVPLQVPTGDWTLMWSFTAPGRPASPPATASLTIER